MSFCVKRKLACTGKFDAMIAGAHRNTVKNSHTIYRRAPILFPLFDLLLLSLIDLWSVFEACKYIHSLSTRNSDAPVLHCPKVWHLSYFTTSATRFSTHIDIGTEWFPSH